jgi:hypothetical protein
MGTAEAELYGALQWQQEGLALVDPASNARRCCYVLKREHTVRTGVHLQPPQAPASFGNDVRVAWLAVAVAVAAPSVLAQDAMLIVVQDGLLGQP